MERPANGPEPTKSFPLPMPNAIKQLLCDRGVRPTPIRVGVLALLIQSSKAHTHADLERAFNHKLNRISLYRCLITLCEAGLLQKLINTKGVIAYFYTLTAPSVIQPHFKCSQCETVISLPQLPESYLPWVDQYQIDAIHFLAEGLCTLCRRSQTERVR